MKKEAKKDRGALKNVDAAELEVFLCTDPQYKFNSLDLKVVTAEINEVLSDKSKYKYPDPADLMSGIKKEETLLVKKPCAM